MNATLTTNPILQQAKQLKKDGYSIDKIIESFQSKNIGEDVLQEIKKILLQEQFKKNRHAGFIWVGVGFFLLSFGFVLTLLLYGAGVDFDIAMYGLTIIGVGCTLKGIVNIMGW